MFGAVCHLSVAISIPTIGARLEHHIAGLCFLDVSHLIAGSVVYAVDETNRLLNHRSIGSRQPGIGGVAIVCCRVLLEVLAGRAPTRIQSELRARVRVGEAGIE